MIDTSIPSLTRAQLLGSMVVNAIYDACTRNNTTAFLRNAVLIARPDYPSDLLKVEILFDSVRQGVEFSFDIEVPKESTNCDLSEFDRNLNIIIGNATFSACHPASVPE